MEEMIMRQQSLVTSLGLFVFLVFSAPAQAEITVQFVGPDRYTDAGDRKSAIERNLRTLERYLKTFGQPCLRPGETLEIRVFDVDLAGRIEWRARAGSDLRVLRESTWPRLDLNYLWRDAAGNTIGEGRELASDMNYLRGSAFVRHDLDDLPYEKIMLRDWLRKRFCRD
jgi:hypothetical protein